MPFYCTTTTMKTVDGEELPASTVVEVAGDKQDVVRAKWSSRVKGPQRHIEYWYRARKVRLDRRQLITFALPFIIRPEEFRLE